MRLIDSVGPELFELQNIFELQRINRIIEGTAQREILQALSSSNIDDRTHECAEDVIRVAEWL
jgi:hypothetical protein